LGRQRGNYIARSHAFEKRKFAPLSAKS
jgi:hypothetical protein